MYTPPHYRNTDWAEIKDFLVQHSFGILVSQVEGRPWATHLPLELGTDQDGKDIIQGHWAKANPQWRNFGEGGEVLCIFNGPHSYISSSWYKEEEVPTWNYIAVHVYGTLKIIEGEELMAHLRDLVDKYEARSENPVSLERLSPRTLRQVHGVVGFQIEIKDVQATYKLSQGREHDHAKIIAELEKTGDAGSREIAERIRNNLNH